MSAGSSTSVARVLFREEATPPQWLRIVGVVALAAAVLLVVDATVIDPATFQGGAAIAAVVAAVVLVAVGVGALVAKLVVIVDERQVSLALSPIIRKRFARADVNSAKVVPIVVRDFGGIGYRVLPGKKRGLLFSSGDGVLIVLRSGGGSYAVRSDRAAELVKALYSRA